MKLPTKSEILRFVSMADKDKHIHDEFQKYFDSWLDSVVASCAIPKDKLFCVGANVVMLKNVGCETSEANLLHDPE